MKTLSLVFGLLLCFSLMSNISFSQKIFDVHLHGSNDPAAQFEILQRSGVYKATISTSWELQNSYLDIPGIQMIYGLMFPCPNGKVPYSLQPCFEDGADWPPVNWVEEQIKKGKIHFLGEALNQYYGISPSDTLMFPYFRLAQKYQIPVGIHTGGAGPGHGSPHFKMELGNPSLLRPLLAQFPGLKIWIMHGGDQYYEETISIMKDHELVYADISVISNPVIVPAEKFGTVMKAFINNGLEDRLMFGTDNGDVVKIINAIEALGFLSDQQKSNIYYLNAEKFFGVD